MPRNRVGGPGSYNAICDVCGLKYKASELSRRWDGAMVCEADYETRHPQEFVRARRDNPKLPFIRPDIDSEDIAITLDCNAFEFETTTNVAFQSMLQAWANPTVPFIYDVYKLHTVGGTVTVPDGITVRVNCEWIVDS